MDRKLDRKELLKLVEDGKSEIALNKINKQLEIENSIDNKFIKAELLEKFQNYSEAINIYKEIIEINPKNILAKNKKEYVETILKFINADIYASPNTWMDPWD